MKNPNRKKYLRPICGVLFLDKPPGFSSQQAVYRVKRAFYAAKVGHTGSLDPLATGMLPICLGDATKYADYLLSAQKVYEVVGQLGVSTATGDTDGDIVSTCEVTEDMLSKIDEVLEQFKGTITQIPPMYSAVKFQGKALYHFARRGQEVDRIPRQITLFSVERLANEQKNQFSLRVSCSKGTYIRTLVEDIGNALGCGAHVLKLRRFQVGDYTPEHMISLDAIEALAERNALPELDALLLPMTLLVDYLPTATVSPESAIKVKQGRLVEATFSVAESDDRFQILTETGEFLGIGFKNEKGLLAPKRLLADS